MSKNPDSFALMTEEQRHAAWREMCDAVLGPQLGPQVWSRLEPSLSYKKRQIGDDLDPVNNYWEGHWRIHEAK